MSDKVTKNKTDTDTGPLHRWLIRLIWGFGGITLAGIIFGGILLFHINALSNRNAQSGQANQVAVYSQAQIDKFITSVLVSIQNQPLGQADAQADMVFIASFNAFEQRLTLVALAGETLLEVEGHGKKSLSEAYSLGGAGLLVNTMNQNFGLDLQKYVCTDTHTLSVIIDLLGGAQAELTQEEASYIVDALGLNSTNLAAGSVTLTGVQSMVHAMDIRSGKKSLGNLDRSLALINSVVVNLRKNATKEAMLPLLSLVFSSVQTNLDLTTLTDLGYEILKAEEIEYKNLALPVEGSWKSVWGKENELNVDIPLNGVLLRETLYNAQ